MATEFSDLDDWLKALLLRLDPARRRTVNRRVAYDLRRSQRDRIAGQRNPDGSAYIPRKTGSKSLRSKKGTIKRRSMFARLRTQTHLKARSTADGLDVGFSGRSAQIARTHHYGDIYTSATGQRFVTPKRELLGLTDGEFQMLIDAYLKYLAGDQ